MRLKHLDIVEDKAGYVFTEIENRIYEAVIGIVEQCEGAHLITGNGHHIAQKMAIAASEVLQERWL